MIFLAARHTTLLNIKINIYILYIYNLTITYTPKRTGSGILPLN